jgi:hypothetical protein
MNLSPLAAYLLARYPGQSLATGAVLEDLDRDHNLGRAGAMDLHPRLDLAIDNAERHRVLLVTFLELEGNSRAVSTRTGAYPGSGPRLFTVALPEESPAELAARHRAMLLARHPAAYLNTILYQGIDPSRPRRFRVAANLAQQDARLLTAWYPDGLPDLTAPLEATEWPHFQAYVAALRESAEEYATLVSNPRALHRRLVERTLPCPTGTAPIVMAGIDYQVEQGLDRNALLLARRHGNLTKFPPLWYPVPTDRRDTADLHIFASTPDPLTDKDTKLMGRVALTLHDLAICRFVNLAPDLRRCCPELHGRAVLVTDLADPKLVRFHRRPGTFSFRPALDASFSRRRAGDDHLECAPDGNPLLHLAGCLLPGRSQATPTDHDSWPAWALWADSAGHGRAWETIQKRDLLRLGREGRLLDRRSGGLLFSGGHEYPLLDRPQCPTPEEMRAVLAPLTAYVLSDRLLEM